MPYKNLSIEKEYDGTRFSVYVDGKKIGEHLRFDEAIQLTTMIENGEENG